MTAAQLDRVTQRLLLARTARAQRDGRLPSLSVAVSNDHEMLWSAGRGRVHGGRPTTDTQYRMGSITKTFTAVLVMQLRDDGRLQLADRIDRWLPAAGALAGRSVAELLSHTGGVRAETSPPWWERAPGRSWEELVGDLNGDGARDRTRRSHALLERGVRRPRATGDPAPRLRVVGRAVGADPPTVGAGQDQCHAGAAGCRWLGGPSVE
jgi:CubicO group peptidase (beta-lactamase class C family)